MQSDEGPPVTFPHLVVLLTDELVQEGEVSPLQTVPTHGALRGSLT